MRPRANEHHLDCCYAHSTSELGQNPKTRLVCLLPPQPASCTASKRGHAADASCSPRGRLGCIGRLGDRPFLGNFHNSWQPDREDRAAAHLALDRDVAAHHLAETLADREPEAGAAVGPQIAPSLPKPVNVNPCSLPHGLDKLGRRAQQRAARGGKD
jgi:hypothetical protein